LGLQRYYEKRDFEKTPEPRGEASGRKAAAKAQRLSFVIQKHAATRLHYDFRLELDGVLLSWAVPKGPSLDPAIRRLAMQTEDHPIEYGTFEGSIPKGEYGGGTVLLWDNGWWEPEGDPRADYAKGHLRFRLHGQKLQGGFHLVRTSGKKAGEKSSWLLFKSQDEHASPGATEDVVDALPRSVASDRTIDDIAAGPDRVWHSHTSAQGQVKMPDVAAVDGVRKAKRPSFSEPQLATLVTEAPNGDDWLHEIKFDGYRLICSIDAGTVTILSRNGKDWTGRVPALERTLASLAVSSAIFDGELVVLREDGVSDFQALQNSLSDGSAEQTTYFAFDLLHVNGFDLTEVALETRKQLLKDVLRALQADEGRIRYSDHVVGNGSAFHAQACGLGLEGIISKRKDRPYVSGRSREWLKVKCQSRQEFVIAGFSEPGGSRSHIGALLLGAYDKDGLRYVGKVGTGFTAKTLKELHGKLTPLAQAKPSFVNPPRGAEAKGVHWVRPELVGEVEFTGFTNDGRLRHPSFQGLRQDKLASDVVLEREVPVEELTPAALANGGHEQPRAPAKKKVSAKKQAPPKKEPAAKKQAPPKKEPAAKKSGGRKSESAPQRTTSAKARAAAEAESDASDAQQAGRMVLTNPERVLYPEERIVKRELAEYYVAVSGWILPHVARRLLTLVRCPEGYKKQCFYQKHIKPGTPDGIQSFDLQEKDGTVQYMFIDDLEGLLGVVQLGTLELHTWGSHVQDVERPDQLVFDLDPDEGLPWERVVEGALSVRERLEQLGLESFVKTTGGKGLHVVAPVKPRGDWDEVKDFCRLVAEDMTKREPQKYVPTMSKRDRKGKMFIDYLRNGRGATAICAYSTRARAGGTVSVPIGWDELERGTRPEKFTIRTVPERLRSLNADPWAGFFEMNQSITKRALKTLGAG
jgi:bifunctional non-homologous end joining protein LigD